MSQRWSPSRGGRGRTSRWWWPLGALSAYAYALATLPVSTVATYAYVNPVIAVVLGVLVAGERFTVPARRRGRRAGRRGAGGRVRAPGTSGSRGSIRGVTSLTAPPAPPRSARRRRGERRWPRRGSPIPGPSGPVTRRHLVRGLGPHAPAAARLGQRRRPRALHADVLPARPVRPGPGRRRGVGALGAPSAAARGVLGPRGEPAAGGRLAAAAVGGQAARLVAALRGARRSGARPGRRRAGGGEGARAGRRGHAGDGAAADAARPRAAGGDRGGSGRT